jgi:hypothetical protein
MFQHFGSSATFLNAMQQVLSIAAAIPLYQFEQRQIHRNLDVLRVQVLKWVLG